MKLNIKDVALWSNKALAFFLCAKGHDIEKASSLLSKYIQELKKHGFHKHFPRIEDESMSYLRETGKGDENQKTFFIITHQHMLNLYTKELLVIPKNAVDNLNRATVYIRLQQNVKTELEKMIASAFWLTAVLLHAYPLSVLRNGVLLVVDGKGANLKRNVDLSTSNKTNSSPSTSSCRIFFFFLSDGQQFAQALESTFPIPIRQVFVCGPTSFAEWVVNLAYITLPKRIAKTVKVVKRSTLVNLIPEEFLLEVIS